MICFTNSGLRSSPPSSSLSALAGLVGQEAQMRSRIDGIVDGLGRGLRHLIGRGLVLGAVADS